MDNIAKYSATDVYQPDALLASVDNLLAHLVATPLDGAALGRGTLMGKKTIGAITEDHTGNTAGAGAMTGLVAKKSTLTGIYLVTCVTAVANGGIFSVVTPTGVRLADAKVGTAYANDHLGFSIADATDFVVGDKFTITVAAGDGSYIKSLAAAVDGSQRPCGILAIDTLVGDGIAAGEAQIYIAGQFVATEVTFGAGHTADSTRDLLQDQGIFLK